jgi:hypothetical protein
MISGKIESRLHNDSGTSDRQTLYTWFLQEHNKHTLISGEIIREKAKYFYKIIMNKDDFRASDRWLDKFKRRFEICFLTITGEKLSCDISAVDPFVRKFHDKIEELSLGPEQVYKADERSLFGGFWPQNICSPS